MNAIFKNLDVATLIAALITVIFSLYTFKKSIKREYVVKRYEQLIFPLFEFIEPYLFKSAPSNVLNDVLTLIEKNKHLAGGRLLGVLYFCRKNPSQDNYNSLCDVISREFDDCCSHLGLPKRTIWYRIVRKQYKTKLVFILYVSFQTLVFATISVSFLIILFFIAKVIGDITNIQLLPLTR